MREGKGMTGGKRNTGTIGITVLGAWAIEREGEAKRTTSMESIGERRERCSEKDTIWGAWAVEL